MASAIRTVGHEERLSLVEHLGELRTRLIICVAAFGVMFCLCLWQNHRLLHIINKPLAKQTQKQVRNGHGPLGATYTVQLLARDEGVQVARLLRVLQAPHSGVHDGAKAALAPIAQNLRQDIVALSAPPQGDKPVTLGIGEPFTTTLAVSAVFALLLALPIVLFEIYGFILPAFTPR